MRKHQMMRQISLEQHAEESQQESVRKSISNFRKKILFRTTPTEEKA
jgi:hypothetical protein